MPAIESGGGPVAACGCAHGAGHL